jgi:hypothetical protein
LFYFFYFFWRICLFFGALTWIQLKIEKKILYEEEKKATKDMNDETNSLSMFTEDRFEPCRVCGEPSSGWHCGAVTCEACKVGINFFLILFLSFISHFKYTTCMHLLDKNFIVFFYILFKKKNKQEILFEKH